MRFSVWVVWIGFWLLLGPYLWGQSPRALALEARVHDFNNALEFDKAQLDVQQFLNEPDITDDDRYFANIYMSYIYKRLFDYDAVLHYLDEALTVGKKTDQRARYESNVTCQKALAYFDIHAYALADTLMQQLARSNYAYLDDEYQAKIFMQEAYLLYMNKDYALADKRYDLAIEKLSVASRCDLPMVYGKKIELYGAMGRFEEMDKTLQMSMAIATECGIVKYNMYSLEMMAQALKDAGKFEQALRYYVAKDSLEQVYNAGEHLKQITDLEKKYELSKREQEVTEANEKVKIAEIRILLLISILVIAILLFIAVFFGYRQYSLLKSKKADLAFRRQLFENIERERQRISADLHDSVGSELLLLKNADPTKLNDQIDRVLNDIRTISRNLQPVMFHEIGLHASLENLVARLQVQHEIVFLLEIDYARQLSPDAELQLYRMVQEALSNIVKYSGAIAAKISISAQAHEIVTQVMDGGKGFDPKEVLASGKSFGLHSILQRAAALGGTARIYSEAQKTRIEIKIPHNR